MKLRSNSYSKNQGLKFHVARQRRFASVIAKTFVSYARIVSLAASIPLLATFENLSFGQLFWNTNQTSNTLTAANWGTDAAGPYTSPWIVTPIQNITFTANSAITNVTNIAVGNLTITNASTVTWTPVGTFNTNGAIRTFDIGAGSTLLWNSQAVSTSAGTGFIKNGGGTWNIGSFGTNVPGGFTLNAGTIIVGGTSAVGVGALNLNGGIIATNSGTTRNLAVNNILFGGNVQLGDSVNVPAGTGTLGFVAPVNLGNATRTITIGNNATHTFSGVVSNGGLNIAATSNSTGSIALSGANSYDGGTTVSSGILSFRSLAAKTSTGTHTFAAGTTLGLGVGTNGFTSVDVDNAFNSNMTGNLSNVTVDATTNVGIDTSIASLTYSSLITGSRGLAKLGANTLTLDNSSNNYTGGTNINAGTLLLGHADAIGTSGTITFSGGTLLWGTGVTTDLSSRFGGGTGRSYNFNTGGNNVTLASDLIATSLTTLTKTGAGTLTLSGNNAYLGLTTITDGTLAITSSNALGVTSANLGVGNTSVSSGATLQFQGNSIANLDIISLSGTGVGGLGALRNSGPTDSSNTTAQVNVTINTSIGVDAGTTLFVSNIGTATGAFSLTKVGDGTLVVRASAVHTGATTITGGTFQLGDGGTTGTLPAAGTISIGTGANLAINRSAQLTQGLSFSTVPITGDGSFTQRGTGNTILNAANTYSGGTFVNAGTLTIAGATGNVLPDLAPITVQGGTLALGANNETVGAVTLTSGSITGTGTTGLTSTSGFAVASGTVSARLAGTVGLTKSTVGTVTLSDTNSYTGLTTISAGTLQLGSGGTLGILAPGGTILIETGADFAINRSSPIVSQGASFSSSPISGGGSFTQRGIGNTTLNAVNTYSGGTFVDAGTLTIGGTTVTSDVLLDAGAVTVRGGTLALGANSETVGAVTLTSGSITSTTGVLTSGSGFAVAGGSVSAILAGSVGLTKSTGGTVTLSGANTYTGVTTVGAGTLTVNGSLPSGSAVTVASGATLNGTGTIFGTTNINGIHAPGTSPGIQTIFGELTYGSTSTLQWELTTNDTVGRGTNFDGINGGGLALNINPGATSSLVFNGAGSSVNWNDSFWQIDRTWNVFSGYSTGTDSFTGLITVGNDSAVTPNVFGTGSTTGGSFSWIRSGGDLNLQYTAVPEPSSIFLISGMAMCVGLYARRRMNKKGASSVPQDSNDDQLRV